MKMKIGGLDCIRPDFDCISQNDFEMGKIECCAILIEIAKKKRRPISYGKLASQLCTIQYPFTSDPQFRVLSNMIGEISVEDHVAGKPLLSALVINDTPGSEHQGMPGNGFFELAEWLEKSNVSNRITFWANELNDIYNHKY
jgi:hypothetical protein